MKKWLPCKIGTQPALVQVHRKDKVVPGNWVRVKECVGDKWHKVYVTADLADGYFFADRQPS